MASCRLSLFTINLFIWYAFGLLSCYVYGLTVITNFHTFLVFIEANTHLMLQYLFYAGLFILSVSVITKIALGSDLNIRSPINIVIQEKNKASDNIFKIILIIELQKKIFFSVREIHIFVIPKL